MNCYPCSNEFVLAPVVGGRAPLDDLNYEGMRGIEQALCLEEGAKWLEEDCVEEDLEEREGGCSRPRWD